MPTLGIPYTFQNGQVADGAHVSANFQAVKDIVDPIVTNATHTGDVTGDTVLTIGTGKVVEAMIGAAAVSLAKLKSDVPLIKAIYHGKVDTDEGDTGILLTQNDYKTMFSQTITSVGNTHAIVGFFTGLFYLSNSSSWVSFMIREGTTHLLPKNTPAIISTAEYNSGVVGIINLTDGEHTINFDAQSANYAASTVGLASWFIVQLNF